MPRTSERYWETRRLLTPGGGLQELLSRSHRSYLPWGEFLTMRMAPDMTARETWALLQALNRAMGIELPIPDLDDNTYWYLRTHELTDLVSHVQSGCQSGSTLHQRLTASANSRVLVRSRIDETIAAAQLDGLAISEADALDLLQLERTPRDSTERLVANTLSAIDELDDLVGEPFSLELLKHLTDLLIEGVNVSELHGIKPRMGLMISDYDEDRIRLHARAQAEYMCAYADHRTGDAHDHPVLRALLLPDMFRFYRPYAELSSQVGRLAFRLYTLKHDLPVLGMLPLSRMKLQWESRIASPRLTLDKDRYRELREHFGQDMTVYMTLVSGMAAASLEELSGEIERIERRDAELREMLKSDQEINHRQRSILGRAMRNPKAEFRIAYHKTLHGVVYATARADLLQLVDKGYLEVERRGRAWVFTPRKGLKSLLVAEAVRH